MKFTVAAVALVSLIPAVLGLTINTPASVVQCQPILLTWSGGTPPYYISLIPAGQVSATPLETFPTQTGTSLTWTVDQRSGATFNIALKDSTGAVAYSDIVTVQASSDTSCIGSSSNVSGGGSNTNTATTPASTPASSGTTTTPTSGGSGGSSVKSSSTPTPSTGSTSSGNGASGLALSSFGFAGVVGAIAALF